MKRNVDQLTSQPYDVLVIGGGIYGACVAWDAALRGLSVALVEKGDFGSATSANSLKIIHGGLRYLQDGNLRLVRQMSREQQTWLRTAPHLVRPLICLTPTTRKFSRSRLALKLALTLNDMLSSDRNRNMNGNHFLPNGRLIPRHSCLKLLPGLADTAVTGAAIWHDAQMLNSERLLLAVVQAAVAAGAHVANYVEATDFLQDDSRIEGIKATDTLTNTDLTIQASLVINCAGAWLDDLLSRLNGRSHTSYFPLSTATNIVTRQLFADYAVALPGQTGEMRFIVPWQGHSLIGTLHQPHDESVPDSDVKEAAVQTLIDDLNFAFPAAALTREDVMHVHHGFLPTADTNHDSHKVKLLRRSRLHDHEREDGLSGLITVVGVKYTTARQTAAEVIDLAMRKLGQPRVKSRTAETAVHGGKFKDFAYHVGQAQFRRPAWLSTESLEHLIQNYGTNFETILAYYDENPMWGNPVSPSALVLQAEIIHAVRAEMAQTLSDVIQRRTSLGAVGLPDDIAIEQCAALMTAELNWTPQRCAQEVEAVYALYGQQAPQPVHNDLFLHRNGRRSKETLAIVAVPIT